MVFNLLLLLVCYDQQTSSQEHEMKTMTSNRYKKLINKLHFISFITCIFLQINVCKIIL